MSKPTPGPWITKPETEHGSMRVYGRDLAAGPNAVKLIAVCDQGDLLERSGYEDESRANARLMAAAWSLREALEKVCATLALDHPGREIAEAALRETAHEH